MELNQQSRTVVLWLLLGIVLLIAIVCSDHLPLRFSLMLALIATTRHALTIHATHVRRITMDAIEAIALRRSSQKRLASSRSVQEQRYAPEVHV